MEQLHLGDVDAPAVLVEHSEPFFAAFQRYFIKGMAVGAVKG